VLLALFQSANLALIGCYSRSIAPVAVQTYITFEVALIAIWVTCICREGGLRANKQQPLPPPPSPKQQQHQDVLSAVQEAGLEDTSACCCPGEGCGTWLGTGGRRSGWADCWLRLWFVGAASVLVCNFLLMLIKLWLDDEPIDYRPYVVRSPLPRLPIATTLCTHTLCLLLYTLTVYQSLVASVCALLCSNLTASRVTSHATHHTQHDNSTGSGSSGSSPAAGGHKGPIDPDGLPLDPDQGSDQMFSKEGCVEPNPTSPLLSPPPPHCALCWCVACCACTMSPCVVRLLWIIHVRCRPAHTLHLFSLSLSVCLSLSLSLSRSLWWRLKSLH
jgi:hypothetical protein